MEKTHVLAYKLIRPLAMLFVQLKFGYTSKLAKDLPDGNYIVLSNHTTDYDPILVASSFRRQMYFVGSEHIARWKLWYKPLKYFFAPIMRPKGTLGVSTTMEVLRRVRGGSNVCIFAEGARSWDGVTAPILPSTGRTVKSARCALVTYKLVGGYFASPMWSTKNTRRGFFHGEVVNVYTKEQLAEMSVDEINDIIARDLHEDAYARQLADPKPYRGKNLAEPMENLLFLCPKCGAHGTIRTSGDTVSCTGCGMSFRYDVYGMLQDAPFQTVLELARWQKEQVGLDSRDGLVYTAPDGVLSTVKNHVEEIVDRGEVSLSGDVLRCGETEIPTAEILDMQIHGRHALVFSTRSSYYELVSQEHNMLKFLLLYNAHKQRAAAEAEA